MPGPQPVGTSVRDSTASSISNSATNPNITAANAPQQPKKKVKMLSFTAREPRIKQESMRDFADFIRTTGPDKEMNVVPLIPRAGSRQGGSVSGSMLNGFTAHWGGANRKSIGVDSQDAALSSSSSATKRKLNLTAREPSVKQNGNRDLIDFIRQGPPGAGGLVNSPDKRVAAPFNRRTMDSDDMSSARNSNATSATSGTALLSTPGGAGVVDNNGMPKKTRRRVKDPYAIDLDDDDEDLLTALPGASHRPRQREEESLVDFLRNTEPPAGNSPQALAVGVGGQTNGAASGANGMAASRAAKAPRTEQPGTGTRELADFLRNSGPPGGGGAAGGGPPPGASDKAAKMMGGADPPPLARVGSKSKGNKFWRKKATVDI